MRSEFNWNHAAYRAEVSASRLPERAKLLLWWMFDESKRLESAELSVSMAEAAAGVWSHCARRLDVSTVRRALADLVACGIVEVKNSPGMRSRWVLRERKLWALTCGLEQSEAERIEDQLTALRKEIAGLERKREILLGRTIERPAFSGDRLQGGWDVHLSESEVTKKELARPLFRKFVSAGLLADDPETERQFFAFLFTVGSLSRAKKPDGSPKIRSRVGYVAGAIRRGWWSVGINPDFLESAAQLQQSLNGADLVFHGSKLQEVQ